MTTLDLYSADLPAIAGANIKSKYALMTGQPLDEEALGSWQEIEKTIEDFLDADLYLVTVPMWNFGIPYALKYYIDAIVQPGYLFRYDEQGRPDGYLSGDATRRVQSGYPRCEGVGRGRRVATRRRGGVP